MHNVSFIKRSNRTIMQIDDALDRPIYRIYTTIFLLFGRIILFESSHGMALCISFLFFIKSYIFVRLRMKSMMSLSWAPVLPSASYRES